MQTCRVMLMAAAVFLTVATADAQSTGRAQTKAATKPGETFKQCRNCPEMVLIPPGTFTIGSPADEPDRRENERPLQVTIARAFAIGRTEVTWDQWEACVRDRWCDGVGIENALRTNEDGTPNKTFADWGRGTRPVVRELVRRADVRGLAQLEDGRG
jgi:formylglycine-generating enzyme required for sulfatase activity